MHDLVRKLALILSIFCTAVPAPAAVIEDHPAISRYPGSVPSRRDNDGFKRYTLVVGTHPEGKTDEDAFDTITVDGNLTRLAYENPRGRSAHEIFANYREALEAAGFEIMFACAEAECGPGFAASRWGRVTGLRYFAPDMRYLSAKHRTGDGAVHVAILVAKNRHQIEVLEVAEMERGLVTAQAISQGLLTDGRVVLDGIFFDHDKATLKPESKDALDVIARFLTDHPDLEVYIVGHTDGTGTFEYNMNLSRDRAQSVVKALVEDYAIAPGRLGAHGVGPLSPARTNKNEDGRGRNRRVEMVER